MPQTKERHREYMIETTPERLKRKHKRKSELKTLINKIKSEKGCKFCGEKEVICLDFHHKNGEHKDKTVATMYKLTKSKEIILKEIEKCIVVCSNCHRKLHARLLESGQSG